LGSLEAAGAWRGILVRSKTTSKAIANAEIRHAGSRAWSGAEGGGQRAAVSLPGGTVALSATTLADHDGLGVWAGSDSSLEGWAANTLASNSAEADVIVEARVAEQLDAETSFEDPVRVAGAITGEATWPALTARYEATGDLVVDGALTLSPGVQVAFMDDTSILVGAEGQLVADGTTEAPIVLRGTVEAPGHWRGVLIRSRAANSISHTTIAHFGSRAWSASEAGGERAGIALPGGVMTLGDTAFSAYPGDARPVVATDDASVTDTGGNTADGAPPEAAGAGM